MATMGLSCIVSEIDGDLRRKSQNFPTPLYFAPQLKGFPSELGIVAGGQKTRVMGYQFDDIFSRFDTIDQRDRRTDGHRATAETALTHTVAR